MPQFTESNLVFNFPDDWAVIKIDSHRFYSYISGHGYKSVDFIALIPNHQILLIEVKNYNNRFIKDGESPFDAILTDPIAYAESFVQKFQDSFQLLRVGQQYYDRKLWVRFFWKWVFNLFPKNSLLKWDWVFWRYANELIQTPSATVKLILLLQLGEEIPIVQKKELFTKISSRIQAHFNNNNFKLFIVESPEAVFLHA